MGGKATEDLCESGEGRVESLARRSDEQSLQDRGRIGALAAGAEEEEVGAWPGVASPGQACGVRKVGSGGVAVFVDESAETVASLQIE